MKVRLILLMMIQFNKKILTLMIKKSLIDGQDILVLWE